MDNWSYFQENLGVALGSEGSLQEQADIYAESWEAAQMRVKASAQAIYSDLIDDKFFIKMLNTLDKVLEGTDKLIGNLGGLKGILSSISLIVFSLKKQDIAKGLDNMFYSVSMMTEAGRKRVLESRNTQISEAIKELKVTTASNPEESERLRQNFLHEAELQNAAQVASSTASESSMQIIKSNLQTVQELSQQAQEAVKASNLQRIRVQDYLQKATNYRNSTGDERKNIGDHIKTYNEVLQQSNLLYSDDNHAWTVLKEYKGTKVDAFDEMAQASGLDPNYRKTLREALAKSYEDFEAELKRLDTEVLKKYIEAKKDIIDDIKKRNGNKAEAKINEFENFETDNTVPDADMDPVRIQGAYLNAVEQTGKAIGDAAKKQKEWSDVIVETSTVIFSVFSLANAFSGIVDAINNDDLSGWEKFTSILTSISLMAPMLISNFKTLKNVVSRETLGTIANSAAKALNTAELKKNNAEKAKNAQLSEAQATSQGAETAPTTADTIAKKQGHFSGWGKKWNDTVFEKLNEKTKKSYLEKAGEGLSKEDVWQTLKPEKQAEYLANTPLTTRNMTFEEFSDYLDTLDPKERTKLGYNYYSGTERKKTLSLSNKKKLYNNSKTKIPTVQEANLEGAQNQALSDTIEQSAMQSAGKDALKSVGNKGLATAIAAVSIYAAVKGVQALYKAYNKANIAAEEAAATAKAVATAYNDAKTSYNNLKTSIDSWNEKDTALDNLQKGTTEWKEALIEANDAALELINTYDDLEYKVDENGRIKITEESLEAAQEQELLKMQEAQGQAAGAKARSLAAENEADRVEFNRKYSSADAGAAVGQSAEWGGAGAVLGAVLGAGLLTAATVFTGGLAAVELPAVLAAAGVGAGVGLASGLGVGALTGQESEEEKAIVEGLVDSYDKLGSGLYATAEFTNAVNELGLTTDEEISALKELIKSTDANTKAIEAQLQTEGKSALDVWTSKHSDTAYAKAYSQLTEAEKLQVGGRAFESGSMAEYAQELRSTTYGSGIRAQTDKEVGIEYANIILGWDKSIISYKGGNGEGTLINGETGAQLTMPDDTMRDALARYHAERDAMMSAAEVAAIADIPEIRKAGYNIAIQNKGDKSSMHALGNLLTSEKLSEDISTLGTGELQWLVDAYNSGDLYKALSGLDFSATSYGTADNFFYQLGNAINGYDEAGAAANEAKRRQEEFESALAAGADELEVSEAALKHYASTLAKSNEYLKDGTGYAGEYATAQARLRVGLTAVTKAIQDNADKLGSSSKGTLEYSKAVAEVASSMNTLFGVTSITGSFVEDNWAEILKFTTDGSGALDLQKKIAEEYLTSQTEVTDTDVLYQVRKAMDQILAQDLESGELMYLNDEIFNKDNLEAAMKENEGLQQILETLGKIYGYTYDISSEILSISREYDDADFAKAVAEVNEELKEALDIYHEIERAVKAVSNVYDRISKARDRAFGAGKLVGYQAEIDQLSELMHKTEEYQAIAEKELNEQANKLYQDTNGAVQFDETTGEILNWYELALQFGSKFAEEYESALDTWRTQVVAAADYAADQIDKRFEKINYKIDLQLEFAEEDQKYLDFLIGQNNDPLKDAAANIERYNQKVQNMISSLGEYGQGLSEAFNGNIITDLTNIQSINELLANVAKNGLTENEVELLEKYRDSLYEVGEALNEYVDTIKDYVISAFEEMNAQFEDTTSQLEHYNTLLESYKNIIDLTGRDVLGMTDEAYISLLQAQQNNATAQVAANKEIYEANKVALEKLESEYNESWSEDAKEAWNEAIKTAEEQVRESEENLASSWQEALETAASVFESTVNTVVDTFEKNMTGVYGTFEKLQEAYDQQSTLNSRYVADYEKIYTLSKLNRNIQKSIDDTSNLKGKKALRELQQEINELNESDAEVSKYQLDYLQKQYDLRLAQIALEEAQNAKSQVRLKRNSEGNYAYVFTANADEVSKAEQSYEDALYSAQKLTQEYISENEAAIIQIQKEYADAMRNIRSEDYASQEEYQQALKETTEYYQQMMTYRTGELSLAIGNAKTLYDEDWTDYSEKTGYKISKNQEWVDSFKEVYQGLDLKYTDIQSLTSSFTTNMNDLTKSMKTAYTNYQTTVGEVFEAVGTSVEDFATTYNKKVQKIETDTKTLISDFKTLASEASGVFASVVNSASTNYDKFSLKIDEYSKKITGLIKKLDEALEKAAKVNNLDTTGANQTPGVDIESGENKDNGDGDSQQYIKKITLQSWKDPNDRSKGIDTSSAVVTQAEYDAIIGDYDEITQTGFNTKDRNYYFNGKVVTSESLLDTPETWGSGANINGSYAVIEQGSGLVTGGLSSEGGETSKVDPLKNATKDIYADYLVENYDKISEMMPEIRERLASQFQITDENKQNQWLNSAFILRNHKIPDWYKTLPYMPLENSWVYDPNSNGRGRTLQRYLNIVGQMIPDGFAQTTFYGHKYHLKDRVQFLGKNYIELDGVTGWFPEDKFKQVSAFRTGGYTGDWGGTEGRLALLHQKEIVLNKEDTSNLLSTVDMVRNIAKIIDLNAASSANALGILTASAGNNQGQVVEQHVEITASFPNATNHSEIEQAFTTLINQASQFANRKKI